MVCLMQRQARSGTTEPFLGSTPDLYGVRVSRFGEGREKTLSSVLVGLFLAIGGISLQGLWLVCIQSQTPHLSQIREGTTLLMVCWL